MRANHTAFIVIYDSTVPEGEGEGVYTEVNVEELSDPAEIARVRRIKKGDNYVEAPDAFLGDAVRRVYKAVPQKMWVNDAEVTNGVFVRDFRNEVSVDELKAIIKEGL